MVLANKNSGELSQRFLDHDVVARRKYIFDTAKSNRKYRESKERIELEYQEKIEKYGREFARPLGWYVKNTKIDLRALSSIYVNPDTLKGFVNRAHMAVHPSFSSLLMNCKTFEQYSYDWEILLYFCAVDVCTVNRVIIEHYAEKRSKVYLPTYVTLEYFLVYPSLLKGSFESELKEYLEKLKNQADS